MKNILSDGFFKLEVFVAAGLEIPSNCMLSVLHWTIETDNKLIMTIHKASVISTIFNPPTSVQCDLYNNKKVSSLIHRLKF